MGRRGSGRGLLAGGRRGGLVKGCVGVQERERSCEDGGGGERRGGGHDVSQTVGNLIITVSHLLFHSLLFSTRL